jgi:hypothetical protein
MPSQNSQSQTLTHPQPSPYQTNRPPQTEEEQKSVDVVKEYMRLAYSLQENKGRTTVEHLCHPDAYFIAPIIFPDCHSPQGPSSPPFSS